MTGLMSFKVVRTDLCAGIKCYGFRTQDCADHFARISHRHAGRKISIAIIGRKHELLQQLQMRGIMQAFHLLIGESAIEDCQTGHLAFEGFA